jgi:uncharacterized protein (UPF0261 family)
MTSCSLAIGARRSLRLERGLASWFRERSDTIAGVLAIGGSAGTSIATANVDRRHIPDKAC